VRSSCALPCWLTAVSVASCCLSSSRSRVTSASWSSVCLSCCLSDSSLSQSIRQQPTPPATQPLILL
jgi:hypothetical protein